MPRPCTALARRSRSPPSTAGWPSCSGPRGRPDKRRRTSRSCSAGRRCSRGRRDRRAARAGSLAGNPQGNRRRRSRKTRSAQRNPRPGRRSLPPRNNRRLRCVRRSARACTRRCSSRRCRSGARACTDRGRRNRCHVADTRWHSQLHRSSPARARSRRCRRRANNRCRAAARSGSGSSRRATAAELEHHTLGLARRAVQRALGAGRQRSASARARAEPAGLDRDVALLRAADHAVSTTRLEPCGSSGRRGICARRAQAGAGGAAAVSGRSEQLFVVHPAAEDRDREPYEPQGATKLLLHTGQR